MGLMSSKQQCEAVSGEEESGMKAPGRDRGHSWDNRVTLRVAPSSDYCSSTTYDSQGIPGINRCACCILTVAAFKQVSSVLCRFSR